MTLPPQRSDQDGALGRQIAELDTSTRKHRDRVLVKRVAGLRAQFDELASPAYLELKPTAGAALVRVIDPNDGKAQRSQLASPLASRIGSHVGQRQPTGARGSRRAWLSGLAVTLTTIISYMAFWRLSPGVTFIVGCLALLGLIVAGWVLGGSEPASRRAAKEP